MSTNTETLNCLSESLPLSFPTRTSTVNKDDAFPLAWCSLPLPGKSGWGLFAGFPRVRPAGQLGPLLLHSSANIYPSPTLCQHGPPRLQLWPDCWLQRQTLAINRRKRGARKAGARADQRQRLWHCCLSRFISSLVAELVGLPFSFSAAASPDPPTRQRSRPPPLAHTTSSPDKLPSLPHFLPEAKGHSPQNAKAASGL